MIQRNAILLMERLAYDGRTEETERLDQPLRDFIKRKVSTNARHSLLAAWGEVARIGRWIELRRDPLCLGQMLNHNNSGFARRAYGMADPLQAVRRIPIFW